MTELDETKRNDIMSLKQLESCLRQTITRVNATNQPTYVAVRGQPGVAIVDLDEYREMERLAERGLIAEIAEQVAHDEAEGALSPVEAVERDLRQIMQERKRRENG